VWSSCKGLRWLPLSLQSNPLSSFASVQSLSKPNLADQPQPVSRSLGLSLPTAHEEPKVHCSRARPPASFRLQGLATLLTAYALQLRAGSVSHRQRSWDSPSGAFSSRKVSGALPSGWPTCRSTCRYSHHTRRWAGPNRPQLLGFDPFESPWRLDRGLICRPLDAPLGFVHQITPERSGENLTGICVHLASCRTSLPTTRCSLANFPPYRSRRDRPYGAEHTRADALRPKARLSIRSDNQRFSLRHPWP
jgi:hypothetical protein